VEDVEDAKRKIPLYEELYDSTKQSWENLVAARAADGEIEAGLDADTSANPQPHVFFFQPVEDEMQGVQFRGFSEQILGEVEHQFSDALGNCLKCSEPLVVPSEDDETLQQVLAHFTDFYSRRDLVQMKVEEQGDGSVILRALGDFNLLRAEKEFDAWKLLRTQSALEREAQKNQVTFPSEWTKVVSKDDAAALGVQFVTLDKGEDKEEWKKVEALMRDETGEGIQKGLWTKKITNIERVENPNMWRSYWWKCLQLQQLRGDANEIWAKHGTKSLDPHVICRDSDGVDKNFSDAGMFGRATYVAEDTRYSDECGYCYDCSDNISRQILLCRVAAGTITNMKYSAATQLLRKAPEPFDSIRGDVASGRYGHAVMLYRDYQVYPFYLVTFAI